MKAKSFHPGGNYAASLMQLEERQNKVVLVDRHTHSCTVFVAFVVWCGWAQSPDKLILCQVRLLKDAGENSGYLFRFFCRDMNCFVAFSVSKFFLCLNSLKSRGHLGMER